MVILLNILILLTWLRELILADDFLLLLSLFKLIYDNLLSKQDLAILNRFYFILLLILNFFNLFIWHAEQNWHIFQLLIIKNLYFFYFLLLSFSIFFFIKFGYQLLIFSFTIRVIIFIILILFKMLDWISL